jgi:addiction module HigA family antidote
MMHNPPHPGAVLRDGWLAPAKVSVTAAAEGLGVTRKTLSAILNGRAGISAEMAIRLAKFLGTTAEFWLTLQMHHDLWHAERRVRAKVRVSPLARLRAVRAQVRPRAHRTARSK